MVTAHTTPDTVHVCRYSHLDDAYYLSVDRSEPAPLLLALPGPAFADQRSLHSALIDLGLDADRRLVRHLRSEAQACRASTSGTYPAS